MINKELFKYKTFFFIYTYRSSVSQFGNRPPGLVSVSLVPPPKVDFEITQLETFPRMAKPSTVSGRPFATMIPLSGAEQSLVSWLCSKPSKHLHSSEPTTSWSRRSAWTTTTTVTLRVLQWDSNPLNGSHI